MRDFIYCSRCKQFWMLHMKLYSTHFSKWVQLLWANVTLNESCAFCNLYLEKIHVLKHLLRQNKSELCRGRGRRLRLLHFNQSWVVCMHPQSCLTIYDPMVCNPPDSSVPGISQARPLEWVAISSSRGLPDPGIQPGPLAMQVNSLPLESLGLPW